MRNNLWFCEPVVEVEGSFCSLMVTVLFTGLCDLVLVVPTEDRHV